MSPYSKKVLERALDAVAHEEMAIERGSVRQMDEAKVEAMRATARIERYVERLQARLRKRKLNRS